MDGIKGRIHSIQTLGTLDGPGVRFVVFLQGCPLRCGVCHNPDTWETKGGTEYTAEELAEKAEHYREYFGQDGGVTLSGGEPLLQAEFAAAFFKSCHARGIHTCLDTAGCILNDVHQKAIPFIFSGDDTAAYYGGRTHKYGKSGKYGKYTGKYGKYGSYGKYGGGYGKHSGGYGKYGSYSKQGSYDYYHHSSDDKKS